MIIVKIIGGLGNQMFSYAFAKALEKRGNIVKIDISGYKKYTLHDYQLNKYYIDLPVSTENENSSLYGQTFLNKIMRRIGLDFSKRIKEKNFFYQKKFLEITNEAYFEGYFQSEKYFKDIKNIITKQFTIKSNISSYTNDLKKIIIDSNNSCSLHIRRGDYVNAKNISTHGICDLKYYKNAISYLEKKFGVLTFFIFSDDIEWCKNNLKIDNAVFVNSEEKRIAHEDIYLMSICNHNIIANSSFSWWGAWLNINDDKIVIAPKDWFADNNLNNVSSDIVPEDWVRI
jgi:hypothetical protein